MKDKDIWTNSDSVFFGYSKEDQQLFTEDQRRHWEEIAKEYYELKIQCLNKVQLPESANHKAWISSRVNLHATTSLMRLLYLIESFRDAALQFNVIACAVHVKAMVEIPMHLSYLAWILDSDKQFRDIRVELDKLAFGYKDKETGLTVKGKITQKEFYTRADEMMEKFFKDDPSNIRLLETLYKESNVVGHHNHEGRNMLSGLITGDTWYARDRKELFVFYCNNIFQLFLHCSTVLTVSVIFMEAINHYLNQLPDYIEEK